MTIEAKTLPRRGRRLAIFQRLKAERRILRGMIAAGLVAATGAYVIQSGQPEPLQIVTLGKGKAGVDPSLSARSDASTLPSKKSFQADDTIAVDAIAEEAAHLLKAAAKEIGVGEASFYGDRFAGRPTASGEIFDPADMTAAHRTLPMGSKVRVTRIKTGDSVIVEINDRGPFHGRRVIDLSKGAAKRLDMIRSGTAQVKLELLRRR